MKSKSLRKRIISLVLAAMLCVASSITVFASNSNVVVEESAVVEDSAASTWSIGSCVGSNGVITSGYGCDLVVHLDKSYFDVYVRAGATGNANNGISCSVTFPDGYTYPLGYIVADGSKTPYLIYDGTAPAGDYVFHFTGTDSGTTGFLGFIYD